MSPRIILPIVVLVFAGMAVIAVARPAEKKYVFTTEKQFTAQTLTNEADAIVVGRFESSKSYTDKSTGQAVVLTDWQVSVSETWKGNVGKTITVTVEGGDTSGNNQAESGLAEVSKGQTRLLYLRKITDHNTWIPLSYTQGWLTPQGQDSYKAQNGSVSSKTELRKMVKS